MARRASPDLRGTWWATTRSTRPNCFSQLKVYFFPPHARPVPVKMSLELNRSAVGKYQLLGEPESALLCSCFASEVACPNCPSFPRDQCTY